MYLKASTSIKSKTEQHNTKQTNTAQSKTKQKHQENKAVDPNMGF